ncbi:hypothetical protein CFAM422_004603 [Trichoderma lentiforme]|uniref:Uncharacterized protein n=1 Tax=Trichoderma lentiforme TaxID=1567552 RepID=A0A9P5CFZ6_9HYPO|nr:hypothetical protein CFAM422_004603 [Trichoderma lentiforme]
MTKGMLAHRGQYKQYEYGQQPHSIGDGQCRLRPLVSSWYHPAAVAVAPHGAEASNLVLVARRFDVFIVC